MKPRHAAERRRFAAAALALAAPAARALMAGDPPDSPTRRLDANRADSPFAAVGSLTRVGGSVFTGVLVAPRHVLTAAHVVPADATQLVFNLNLGGDLTHMLGVRRAHVHPRFKGFVPPNPPNDLAVLELSDAAPAGLALPVLAPRPLAPGTLVELVGYGASGTGGRGVSVAANAALRRIGANVIDHVLPGDDPNQPAAIYVFTFDAPERPPYKTSRSLGNTRETGLASGDSGSPAFVSVQGRRFLAGINTFVQRRNDQPGPMFAFGSIGGGQILHAHLDWLRALLGPGKVP